MDKKEASFILANIDRRVCDDELNEALDMAIKALEQEPKTDTWSIKDVANTFKKHGLIRVQEPSGNAINRKLVCAFLSGLISDETERKKALEYINELPPVNPTKTGHWIFDDECKEHGHCSRCGYGSVDLVDGESHNFCRNCGAWMVESLEKR